MFPRRALFAIVLSVWVAGLVGCDHATKLIAQQHLQQGQRHECISGVLDLRYVENRAAAFGALGWVPEQLRFALLLSAQAMVIALALGLILRPRGLTALGRLALALALAGGLGNFIGRAVRGYVIDFIHLPYWPVFNLADVYITVGMALLLLSQREMLRSS